VDGCFDAESRVYIEQQLIHKASEHFAVRDGYLILDNIQHVKGKRRMSLKKKNLHKPHNVKALDHAIEEMQRLYIQMCSRVCSGYILFSDMVKPQCSLTEVKTQTNTVTENPIPVQPKQRKGKVRPASVDRKNPLKMGNKNSCISEAKEEGLRRTAT